LRRRALTALAAFLAPLALVAACASEAGQDPLAVGGLDLEEDLDDELDGSIAPQTGLDGDDDAPTSDEVVQAALLDAEAFWDREYEDLYGEPFEPLAGGYWAYGPRGDQPPCGDPAPRYEDIAGNAFFCPSDDLIAWDNVNLIPGMYDAFGGFTIGIVMAHEFGHAIQDRAEVVGDTIMTELQADCFAGAWTADVARGNSRYFELRTQDLDKAIAGFLELRDGVGTAAEDPLAHGTGFDRIGAFTEGFGEGLERCAGYPDLYDAGELVIVEVPFTDAEDFERGGNLPLEQLFDLALEDLEHFWSVVFSEMGRTWTPVAETLPVDADVDEVTCGEETYEGDALEGAAFYCVASDTIVLDVDRIDALDDIGDYAVATDLARQYAYAAQVRLGNLDNSRASNLQADCFAGVYAASGFTVNRSDEQVLVLSPGDLDEAVIAFLVTSDEAAEGEEGVGTAFERFDAYRSGFMEGVTACEAILTEAEDQGRG
jgi:predicted metalloprotease